ncbi:MAG: hypothetical protein LBQ12_05040, partial [Deltaproteobacteria bacterium]|nr:hypothetical protein [Deltaproteobacteria bacterium]
MDKIEKELYFCLHAPRQSGKTTCLQALVRQINSEGKYYAFDCTLDSLRNTTDPATAMKAIVDQIYLGLAYSGVAELAKLAHAYDDNPFMSSPSGMVRVLLNSLCMSLDRELVVFFDEADCLHEDPLVLFLSQVRAGFNDRFKSPGSRFPRSLAL